MKLKLWRLRFWIEVVGRTYGYNWKFITYSKGLAYLESGNGQSKLSVEHNNYFGMTVPSRRSQPAGTYKVNMSDNGDPNVTNFSGYTSIRASVVDYYMRQNAFKLSKAPKDLTQFANEMNESYYSHHVRTNQYSWQKAIESRIESEQLQKRELTEVLKKTFTWGSLVAVAFIGIKKGIR